MLNKALVEVIIRAKDLTGTAATQFRQRWAAMTKQVKDVGKALAVFTAAVVGSVVALVKLADHGARVIGVKAAFARTTDDETAALERLRRASDGTITDLDLMARHNQALALGTARSTEEFARMLRISDALGDSLGIDGVQAMEKFADVMASGSQRAARALGIEIEAGATRNEILAAAEEVVGRISGEFDEGAESAGRFWTEVKNSGDQIAALVAQSPVVAKFFEVMTVAVEGVTGALEKLLRWVLRVPEAVGTAGAGAGGGGGAAPLDEDLRALGGGFRDMSGFGVSPEGLAAFQANQEKLRRARFQMGLNVPGAARAAMAGVVGTGSGDNPFNLPGVTSGSGAQGAALELQDASAIAVDSLGRMADAAVSESGRMSDAIIGSLQQLVANIKMKEGGLFGSTLFGGLLGVGLGLAGSLLSRKGRDPVPVALTDVSDRAAQQMRDKGGPPIRVTTIVEQGGVEIQRIERELHSRQNRDEVVRFSPVSGNPLWGR